MPVSWITLTLADLPVAKADALVNALRTAALGAGQADPMPEVLTNATNRIRMEIAAGGRTALDADPTKIPPSLKSLSVRLALREGQSRLNALGGLPLSEDERQESKDDLRFLERIARAEITVEASDNPEATPTVQAKTGRPRITSRCIERQEHL